MWTHLDSTDSHLSVVFRPFYNLASEFQSPWSIAELRITDEDLKWLISWFHCLSSNKAYNWVKSLMLEDFEGGHVLTYRQMFGSLLLCASAEICRERSNEDSVWPTLRGLLSHTGAYQAELFGSNGQPSTIIRDMISDSVRALNLRHAMDIEGTQQWFVTVKLQFGFTYKGAKKRLAEWLVNLGRPHAVEYLNGVAEYDELKSHSFNTLWTALIHFRQNAITTDQARTILFHSPWVKKEWINTLLEEARARILTLGTRADTTEAIPDEEVSTEELQPITNIELEWKHGQSPRLRLFINKEAILENAHTDGCSELDFHIDGRRICRWLYQADRSWKGEEGIYVEPEIEKMTPQLSPRVLSVRTRAGDSLVEWDFEDSGLAEDIIIFDLDAKAIFPKGEKPLSPGGHYAILCDKRFELKGLTPLETFERPSISRKAMRLPTNITESFSIVFGNFELWQPVREVKTTVQEERIILSTPGNHVYSLGERTKLFLSGIPTGVESVELLIHTKKYQAQKTPLNWTTVEAVDLTSELLSKQYRTAIRYQMGGKHTTRQPLLALQVLGAAALQMETTAAGEDVKLDVLKRGTQINRSDGAVFIKVWAPNPENHTQLLEGDAPLGRLRHSKLRFTELHGLGGTLSIRVSDKLYDLGIQCCDKGCVRSLLPSILNCPAQLVLSQEKDHREEGGKGYELWAWTTEDCGKSQMILLPSNAVLNSSTKKRWDIHYPKNSLAIGLAWKGSWLGSWWDIKRISQYVQTSKITSQDFLTMKWLRVPILDSALSASLKQSIRVDPMRLLKAYSSQGSPNAGLKHQDNVPGIDTAIRHFLWNDFMPIHTKEAIAILGDAKAPVGDWSYLHCLDKCSQVSPTLLWTAIELFRHRHPVANRPLLEIFSCTLLGLPGNSQEDEMRNRLQGLERQVLRATGLKEEKLKIIITASLLGMTSGQPHVPPQYRSDFLRLGETQSGRRFVAARIARHMLDR